MGRAKKEPEGILETFTSLSGVFERAVLGEEVAEGLKTAVDDLVVSTVDTTDLGWETAIMDAEGAHPVERYESARQAKKGHKRWCKRVVGETSIPEIGYGTLLEGEPRALVRPFPEPDRFA